jgi:hypothetical protein
MYRLYVPSKKTTIKTVNSAFAQNIEPKYFFFLFLGQKNIEKFEQTTMKKHGFTLSELLNRRCQSTKTSSS